MSTGTITTVLFGAAGGIAAVAARELLLSSPAAVGWIRSALEPLVRSGSDGYRPSESEQRRLGLLASGAVLALAVWWTGLGPTALLAGAGPGIAVMAVTRRNRRYRRAVEKALPAAATAVADALEGGRSVRAALIACPGSLDGAGAAELGRLAADLELGRRIDDALADLRARIGGHRVEALATALASRLPAPDTAQLLRGLAEAEAHRDRVAAEARTATAQARFTGVLVAAMPVAVGLLAELLKPGFLATLVGDSVAAAMLTAAVLIQLAGFLAISRIAGRLE